MSNFEAAFLCLFVAIVLGLLSTCNAQSEELQLWTNDCAELQVKFHYFAWNNLEFDWSEFALHGPKYICELPTPGFDGDEYETKTMLCYQWGELKCQE